MKTTRRGFFGFLGAVAALPLTSQTVTPLFQGGVRSILSHTSQPSIITGINRATFPFWRNLTPGEFVYRDTASNALDEKMRHAKSDLRARFQAEIYRDARVDVAAVRDA